MSPHFRSLSSRIIVGATAAVALALLLAGTYFAVGERDALERVFAKQGQTLANALAVFSIEQLVSQDYPALEHALQIAGQNNDSIQFIEVSDDDQPVARFGRADAPGREFAADIATRAEQGSKIGRVRIIFSTRDHDALQLNRLREHAVTMFLIFVVTGFSLRGLLRRTVIKPIQALSARTEQTIAEALPELASLPTRRPDNGDEIQQLDARFVSLLDGLKMRDQARGAAELALIEHKNNLEKMVDERTCALQIAQKEATRLNKVKSEFLAAASHDLRQPIQALNLFHATLARSPLNEDQQKINHFIGLSLHSLGDILNTLLDISKIDAGMVRAVPQPISTEALFARIEAEFAPMAQAKNLRFKLAFPFTGMTLFTDPDLLFSLLRNLIDNAIKYSKDGGILVGIRRRERHALIQIWDTGIGISPEHKVEIFEEYVQVGNPERDNRKGLGLGLSIVSRLARLLGGDVTCHSRLGRGTVFAFSVPLAAEPSVARQRPGNAAPAESSSQFAGQRIVVVENDPLIVQALTLSLGALGMQVATFANAEEALASATLDNARFYIADYRLPGRLHGLQFLNMLQQRSATPIKAVLITGSAAAKQGALGGTSSWPVLFKPVDLERLLAALAAQCAAPPHAPRLGRPPRQRATTV